MPVCAICEEVVDKVYRCADCGINFCKDCGDPNPKKKLCALCMPYKAEEEKWPKEEEREEGEEWWWEEEEEREEKEW